MKLIRTILFDLDGTLIDSIELILASYRHTLTAHGFPVNGDDAWLAGLGRPLQVQLGQWARSETELAALVATYRAYNLAHHDRMVRTFDGVPELLAALRQHDYRLGVVSSKNRDGCRRGLSLVGLEDAMEVLVSADDVSNPKPDPEPVTRALLLLDADPGATVYVGDSIHDMQAGRGAGVRTAAALWGPFQRAHLEPAEPDYWLERPGELLGVLNGES
jgi:pyrophosphatase PpaX